MAKINANKIIKILLATDGSDFSRAAIDAACEILAGGKNNYIEIISVSEEVADTGTEPFGVSADYIREVEKIGREKAAKIATEAEEMIRGRVVDSQVKLTTKIVKGASAGKTIVEEAQNGQADLIVVGSHGHGFWKRAFLGSTSDKVIHNAPCSVLVVRKKINV